MVSSTLKCPVGGLNLFLKYTLANLARGLVNLAKNATAALAKSVLRPRDGAVPASNGVMLFLRGPQHRDNTTTLSLCPWRNTTYYTSFLFLLEIYQVQCLTLGRCPEVSPVRLTHSRKEKEWSFSGLGSYSPGRLYPCFLFFSFLSFSLIFLNRFLSIVLAVLELSL